VKSGAVEMGMDIKIQVKNKEGKAISDLKYQLIRGDDKIEGSVDNGKIEKEKQIPGEYLLKLKSE
jgi:hypothetical protein